jgi:hypothetical protein
MSFTKYKDQAQHSFSKWHLHIIDNDCWFYIARNGTVIPSLEPGLHLGLSILQSPLTTTLLTSCLIDLLIGESTGLRRRVVAQSVPLTDLRVRNRCSSLAIGTFVHSANNGATKAEIVL